MIHMTHHNSAQDAKRPLNRPQLYLTHCNSLQLTAIHCNAPQHTATSCNNVPTTTVQKRPNDHSSDLTSTSHIANHCNSLQYTATRRSTLQQAATTYPSQQCERGQATIQKTTLPPQTPGRCVAVCCSVLHQRVGPCCSLNLESSCVMVEGEECWCVAVVCAWL